MEKRWQELICQTITDSLFLLSVESDGGYRFVLVNEAFLKERGLAEEDVIGKRIEEVIPEQAYAHALVNYREALSRNRTVSWEEVSASPAGNRVLNVKVAPARDGATGQTYLVGLVRDITASREKVEALRLSEERFRAMIEHGSDIISLHDAKGRMLYQSPSVKRILGYEQDELVGRQVLDYIHPEDKRYTKAEIEKVRSSPGIHAPFETRFRHKDGTWRWFECIGNNQLDNPAVGQIIFSARHITARKQVEAQLQASETRFRSVVESMREGLLITDFEDRVIYANPRLTQLTGYKLEDLAGKPAYKVLLPPEHWGDILQKNIQRSKGAGERYEHRLKRKDGSWLWAETNASPFRTTGGEIIGTIGIITDISERKRSEAALRESEERLRQSQKLESIGQLAGGIAHDFNNMLTAINGYSELILRQLEEADPLRQKVEEIKKAGERAGALTYQLLAFSRKQILRPETLDINDIVFDVAKMLQRLIGEDIDLTTILNERLGQVETDPGQITQVLMNLAVNARDAMPSGGKLIIETDNVYLGDIYADKHIAVTPGRYVMLAVSDTGVGMDAETQQRIFEPFFTTKEVGRGTGMGLATVYGIVKQSGGNIWVYSEVGHGTTFKIYLPRVDKESERIQEQPDETDLPAGTEKILLVEDEDLVRDLTRQVLEMCGYAVIEASNGAQALKLCDEIGCDFDLLITDVVMPNMGGRELVRRLAETRPALRVLYFSGYTDSAIVHHGVLDEGTNFIQKPFTTEAFAKKVREVLDS